MKDAEALDGAGRALFGLVRFWSRRWMGVGGGDAEGRKVQDILAVEAVASVRSAGGEANVNDVARHLGIDQSNASRLIAQAVQSGVLGKQRSARDGRATTLVLLPQGEALIAASWRYQEDLFRRMVADWDPEDQARLAGYLKALAVGRTPGGT